MAVSNQTNRISATGSGSAGQEVDFVFPVTASSDLLVIMRVTATGVETEFTENSDYTVADPDGGVDPTADWSSGGTVTTVTAVTAAQQIHIIRDTPMTQTLDLESGDDFSSTDIEAAIDRNTRLIQENSDTNSRILRFPNTDPTTAFGELDNSVDRAGKYLYFDSSTGAPTVASETDSLTTTVSSFMETVLDDTSAAAVRATLGVSAVFNVKTYGAVGDGATDDTAAIKLAIAAAAANQGSGSLGSGNFPTSEIGGIVYFPPGRYLITDTLDITEGIYLVGNGKYASTIYNTGSGVPAIKFANSGRSSSESFGGARNLKILGGSSADAGAYGIEVNVVHYLDFENLLIMDHGDSGIYVHALTVGGNYRNVYSYTNRGDGIEFENLTTSTAHNFYSCQFRVNDGIGINLAGTKHTFHGTVSESNGGIGVVAQSSTRNCTFYDLYLENNEITATTTSVQMEINGHNSRFYNTFVNAADGIIKIVSGGVYSHFYSTAVADNSGAANFQIDSGATHNLLIMTASSTALVLTNNGGESNRRIDNSYMAIIEDFTLGGNIIATGSDELEIDHTSTDQYIRVSGGDVGAGGQIILYGDAHANASQVAVTAAGGATITADGGTTIDQSSASGAVPVLKLDQADIDDSFVDIVGTSAADGTRSISSDTTEEGAKFGAFRVEINGVTKWIRVYDDHS